MENLALGLVGLSPIAWLPETDLTRCGKEADAVMICWAHRRVKYTVRHAAELLGMPTSHLSNILSGKKYLPNDFRIRFQTLCGNWAIRQLEDRQAGLETKHESPEQIELRQLRERVRQLEAA